MNQPRWPKKKWLKSQSLKLKSQLEVQESVSLTITVTIMADPKINLEVGNKIKDKVEIKATNGQIISNNKIRRLPNNPKIRVRDKNKKKFKLKPNQQRKLPNKEKNQLTPKPENNQAKLINITKSTQVINKKFKLNK